MLDRLAGLWNHYGRIVLGAAGAVIVVVVAAVFTLRQGASQNNEAAKKLAEANVLFLRGDYAQAMSVAQEVSKAWGSTPSGIDAHRIAGDAAFWQGQGRFRDAITEYRTYLARKHSGILAQSVQRSLAYALDSDRQYAEAAKVYDSLVGVFDRESSAEMLFASARCLELTRNRDEAVRRLRRVADEFGETSYANRARLTLAGLGAAPN